MGIAELRRAIGEHENELRKKQALLAAQEKTKQEFETACNQVSPGFVKVRDSLSVLENGYYKTVKWIDNYERNMDVYVSGSEYQSFVSREQSIIATMLREITKTKQRIEEEQREISNLQRMLREEEERERERERARARAEEEKAKAARGRSK